MPEFLFAATDGSGQQVQGKATAADMATAVAYVASQGYTLLHIELVQPEQTAMQAEQTAPQTALPLQQTQPVMPRPAPESPPPTPPAATVPEATPQPSAADILKADEAKRRKLERELQGMGMSADEISRLINANATTYEADPNSIMAGLALTAGQALPTAAAKGSMKRAAAAASLEQFAAQLTEQQAKKNKEAVAQASVNLQLPEFRQASIQDSIKAEPLLREANMLRKSEKHKLAEQKVREALNYTPQDASALEMLGDILQSVGRVDEALAAYKRASEADAKRTSSEKKYGDLLMRQRNWDIGDPEQVTVNNRAAVLMSLLFPGFGQVINGEFIKGGIFLALDAFCLYLLLYSHIPIAASKFHPTAAGYVLAGLAVLLWLGSAIDMNLSAKKRTGF